MGLYLGIPDYHARVFYAGARDKTGQIELNTGPSRQKIWSGQNGDQEAKIKKHNHEAVREGTIGVLLLGLALITTCNILTNPSLIPCGVNILCYLVSGAMFNSAWHDTAISAALSDPHTG